MQVQTVGKYEIYKEKYIFYDTLNYKIMQLKKNYK